MSLYAELQVTTNFSFLRGASHPHELFDRAAELGITALGIADWHSLAGIVQAHNAAKASGVKLVIGCRLDLTDATSILVYPKDRSAYARLCRLLTLGKRRAGKAACELAWQDLTAFGEGMIMILVPDEADAGLAQKLLRLKQDFGACGYLALTLRRRPGDAARLQALAKQAAQVHVPYVVTNDVLFHTPERRILQDVLTSIRENCTIDELGFRKNRFAGRHLKSPAEMARLFSRHPEAIARSMEIAGLCTFSLDELCYQYPNEVSEPGITPQQDLERLTWEGAKRRFTGTVPDKTEKLLQHELRLIESLGYAPYFLTVNAIVGFARSQNILCQGRGSAANSAVCYVLGITSIDPEHSNLLFERFVSQERKEPPDIDVDFEHERREEVIQWIYKTYGRDKAALTATVIRYRARGALRDVGKALGLSQDMTGLLSAQVWSSSREGVPEKTIAGLNLNLDDYRLRLTLDLAQQLIGFPRHLSQHPGGFVLTHYRLDELVPIEPAAMADRQVIEWDKDDIDTLKFMKVDILGLGMLGCLRRAFDLLQSEKAVTLDLAAIPQEDPATYAMIQKADTLGVFQIESRAQMAMLPRIKPKTFYDLVIEVAIVRPGPIQGDMVHPYLRRREGKEPVVFPKPELEAVLGKTLGVPLFQEQAMRVAIECAGFTAGEADQLRRSMATFKFTGGVSKFQDKLIAGMVARGYQPDFAARIFKQLEGFGSYGFPESHAASFALLVYVSCWLKCHHPDVFCAALINAQPMGFYAPAQIVRDARAHGVEVRPVDVNQSRWDCTLEPVSGDRLAVRLGLRMVKGLANKDAAKIIFSRGDEPYQSIEELWRRSGATVAALEKLADADAFLSAMKLGRREAIWAIQGLHDEPLPLFAAAEPGRLYEPESVEPVVDMLPMRAGRSVVEDYTATGLSLRQHPVAFLRQELTQRRILPASVLLTGRGGSVLTIAGLVLVRQKPGSAKGTMFLTIEDETGVANLVVWPPIFEKQRKIVLSASMIAARGKLQREGEVIHLIVEYLIDLTGLLRSISDREEPFSNAQTRVEDKSDDAERNGRALGKKARDIYVRDLHIDRFKTKDTLKIKTRDFR